MDVVNDWVVCVHLRDLTFSFSSHLACTVCLGSCVYPIPLTELLPELTNGCR